MKNNSIAKRVLSICLALIMCMSNVSPVLAEEYGIERYDDAGIERPGQPDAHTQESSAGLVEDSTPVVIQPEATQTPAAVIPASEGQSPVVSEGESLVPAGEPADNAATFGSEASGETLPVLPGNVFDLQQGSVAIYDAADGTGRLVEYGGVKYIAPMDEVFVLTGSTAAR